MSKRITTNVLAALLLMVVALIILGKQGDPSTERADPSQTSGNPGHQHSSHSAATISGSEGDHAKNLRRQGNPNSGFLKGQKFTPYRGPCDIDRWTMLPEACWEHHDQSFISRGAGSIALDRILPGECTISFTLERMSDQLDLKLMIFSADINNSRPRSGYELSFQRGNIYLRSGKTRSFLGSDHSRELRQNDKTKIEVRASRKTGTIALFINGEVTEVGNDPSINKNEFGSGLHFIAGNRKIMGISEIEIDPWDSETDEILIQDADAAHD